MYWIETLPRLRRIHGMVPNTMRSSHMCPRCGHMTDRITNYLAHIKRKHLCQAALSNVIPTINNVIKESPPVADAATNSQPNTHDVINVMNVHAPGTTNTINNVVNTTNNYNTTNLIINPYNREDRTHITNAQWQNLVRTGSRDGMNKVVAELVSLINYNPAKPENMNVYMPPLGSSPNDALVFQRRDGDPVPRWRRVNADTVIKWLMNDRMNDIFEWTDENNGMVDAADARLVEDFHDDLQNTTKSGLPDLVHCVATCGSRILLLLRGGAPPSQGDQG